MLWDYSLSLIDEGGSLWCTHESWYALQFTLKKKIFFLVRTHIQSSQEAGIWVWGYKVKGSWDFGIHFEGKIRVVAIKLSWDLDTLNAKLVHYHKTSLSPLANRLAKLHAIQGQSGMLVFSANQSGSALSAPSQEEKTNKNKQTKNF